MQDATHVPTVAKECRAPILAPAVIIAKLQANLEEQAVEAAKFRKLLSPVVHGQQAGGDKDGRNKEETMMTERWELRHHKSQQTKGADDAA